MSKTFSIKGKLMIQGVGIIKADELTEARYQELLKKYPKTVKKCITIIESKDEQQEQEHEI
jgi:uncharacterized protein YfkK (UPF0435 family)